MDNFDPTTSTVGPSPWLVKVGSFFTARGTHTHLSWHQHYGRPFHVKFPVNHKKVPGERVLFAFRSAFLQLSYDVLYSGVIFKSEVSQWLGSCALYTLRSSENVLNLLSGGYYHIQYATQSVFTNPSKAESRSHTKKNLTNRPHLKEISV